MLSNVLAVHTQRWAREFSRRGHDVLVLSIRNANIPGVQVKTIKVGPVNSKSMIWTMLSYIRLLFAAKREIGKHAPDIVNACYAPTHGFIAGFAKKHPLVLSVWGSDVVNHGKGKKTWLLRQVIRYSLERADLVCAASQFLIRETKQYSHHDVDFAHIPYGVDGSVFQPLNEETRESKNIRIGIVKTLDPIYGPETVIQAIAKVVKEIPGTRLIFAGHNKMKAELNNLCLKLDIADHVEFLGFIPNDEVPSILNTFDIFVNASTCQESFGVSVLEASACGLPVIATRVGGVNEVCIDGETGIMIEAGNVDQLAQAILKLARNPTLRNEMGRNGRKFVLNRYKWKENVGSMLAEFSRIARIDSKACQEQIH